jgi:hypothetical protein
VSSIKSALLLIAAAAIPAGAHAQSGTGSAAQSESSLTVYGGYRFGGGFTDVNTGKTWELTEGPAYAVAADFGIDRRTQWELFISHRTSALKASGFAPPAPAADNIGLGVTYYHLGGTYFVDEVGRGVYVVGGLGVTNFSPREADLSSETRFSLNIGVGTMIPLGKSVGLKLEARGYATLVDSSGGFFCSGGCVVQVKGNVITQADLLAGIAVRF